MEGDGERRNGRRSIFLFAQSIPSTARKRPYDTDTPLLTSAPTVSMAAKGDKIEKIIARLQARINEGQYYEAQQQTRVVAARYTKAANWTAAIDILYNVAQSLLKAGQGGSGGDLCVLLVDTYKQAELKPDSASKGKLLTCLRLFSSGEPTRKKYIGEIIT